MSTNLRIALIEGALSEDLVYLLTIHVVLLLNNIPSSQKSFNSQVTDCIYEKSQEDKTKQLNRIVEKRAIVYSSCLTAISDTA